MVQTNLGTLFTFTGSGSCGELASHLEATAGISIGMSPRNFDESNSTKVEESIQVGWSGPLEGEENGFSMLRLCLCITFGFTGVLVTTGFLTLIYMGYFDNLFYMGGGGKKAPQSNSGI